MRFAKYLFDFDGTIMDTKDDVWNSVSYACAQLGYTLPDHFRENPANLSLSEREIFNVVSPSGDMDQLKKFSLFLSHHYRTINDFGSSYIYPQIKPMLLQLNTIGRECIIVSNKPLLSLHKILNRFQLTHYFREILSADRSDTKFVILKRLVYNQEDHCVYIGDSYTDMVASKENGICSIGVLYGDGDKDLLRNAHPDYLVATSSELYELILRWEL